MFGMGMGELLLILVVALLVVGPDKLPTAARAIGKGIRDFRKHTQDLQNTLEQDEKLGEAVRELRSALRDDPLRAPRPLPPRTPAVPPPIPPAAPATPVVTDEPPTVTPAAGAIAKNEPAPLAEPAEPAAPRAKADG
jgi:sec-independent protein translocase protein TatB